MGEPSTCRLTAVVVALGQIPTIIGLELMFCWDLKIAGVVVVRGGGDATIIGIKHHTTVFQQCRGTAIVT